MKTRPVFESFESFVDFMKSEILNEGELTDWKGFINSLQTYLDSDAINGFAAARKAYDKAPTYQANIKDSSDTLKKYLSQLDSGIKEDLSSNKESDAKLIMEEKTTTEVKTLVYTALINGKVNVAEHGEATDDIAGIAIGKQSWVDINDLITRMNLVNIWDFDGRPYSDEGKGKKWGPVTGDKKIVDESGCYKQDYISSVSGGITIGDFGDGSQPDSIEKSLSFKNFFSSPVDGKTATRTLILYGLGKIESNSPAAKEIPDYFIKKDFIKETIPGVVKEYNATIDGSDAMFVQGKSEINKANKEKIDKMITAALAPLAASPESIEITGGASYEPDGQGPINKGLVVARANSVKTYMEKLYPNLVGKIKVNESDDPKDGKYSKIQATDDKDKYEEFRKVYLKIKGPIQGDSFESVTPINLTVDSPIKADTVEIIQYAITKTYSLTGKK